MKTITENNEWIEAIGTAKRVGLTEAAVAPLDQIVFIELPEVGRAVEEGEEVAVLESSKAATALYSPVAGTVSRVNSALVDTPSLLQTDPEGAGWLFEVDPQSTK